MGEPIPRPGSELRDVKRALRETVIARRSAMGAEAQAAASRRIAERVLALPEFQRARGVHCFLSFPDEVDTAPIFEACVALGKATFIPIQIRAERRLGCTRWSPGDPLVPGPFGVPEPPLGRHEPADLAAIDLILTPGAAFDRRGNRLGYGMAYYDGFLRHLADGRPGGWTAGGWIANPPAIALAFAAQIVDRVPTDPWDVRLTGVVTELEIFRAADATE